MGSFQPRRQSLRAAERRSLSLAPPDYQGTVFGKHMDEADSIAESSHVKATSLQQSTKYPLKPKAVARASTQRKRAATDQTSSSARIPKRARTTSASVGTKIQASESLQKTKQAAMAQQFPPTPPQTIERSSFAARETAFSSRDSSPLSDYPSDLSDMDNPFAESEAIDANMLERNAVEDTLEAIESEPFARPVSPIANADGLELENVAPVRGEAMDTSNELQEPAEDLVEQDLNATLTLANELTTEAPRRPTRKRAAPERLIEELTVPSARRDPERSAANTTDDFGSSETEDYPSPKRRKGSVSAINPARTPRARKQVVSETPTAPKRKAIRPRASGVRSVGKSKVVILKVKRPGLKRIVEADILKTSEEATQVTATPKFPTSREAPVLEASKQSKAVLQTPAAKTTAEFPPTPESIISEPFRPDPIDPQQLDISRRLTAREPIGSKPQPQGHPLVWAESRQALCETLPYFKKPQGGCYSNDGHIYGFLFDGIGHCREYMDEDVIICRAGGGMGEDSSGVLCQIRDHSIKEFQPQAILSDIAHQNPIVVMCGRKNQGAKCEMPHQYSVLGWYKPVALWEEKTLGKGKKTYTTIKYRLERLNQAGEPVSWHAPTNSELGLLRQGVTQVNRQQCASCEECCDQVYLQGWMCLNSLCEDFWKHGGVDAPYGAEGLDYNPDFLLQRAPAWGDESDPPAPLRPLVPDVKDIIGDDLAYVNTRGICCPKCGRCNPRRLFDRWICENPTCDYELRPQHRPVMPKHLHRPWDIAPTLVRNKLELGVHLKVEHKFGYKVCTYTFDGIDGCFIHAAATKRIVNAPDGPNDMMANLQAEDLGLERRVFAVTKMSGGKKAEEKRKALPAKTSIPNMQNNVIDSTEVEGAEAHEQSLASKESTTAQTVEMLSLDGTIVEVSKPNPPEQEIAADVISPQSFQSIPVHDTATEGSAPGIKKRSFEAGDLMTAFSMNYGMPYKFVASGVSQSFESSPKAVNDCRYRLNWAARTLLGKTKDTLDFNEELIFTYLEGQKIEYHDDGEDGLGPEIASLSLGGRAKMHVRVKAKHYVGCSKGGVFTEERPIPSSIDGSEMYQKRLAAWEDLQALKAKDTTAYNKRRKELPKELGIHDKKGKEAKDLVTVTLSHGDIMIMDGYDMQRYLEHKVVPEGYLRFALTCRTVLEDHLKPEEKPDYMVEADEGRYDGSIVPGSVDGQRQNR